MGLPEEGPRVTTPASDTLTGRQDRIQREKAILDQLPLLHYIARCIHKRLTRHVLLEDLVHASVIGLIDALGKFDPRKHVQLSSYAKYRIRGAILDSLRGGDWGPRDLRRKARELEKSNHKLRSELGRNPSDSESAAELGLDLHSFHVLQRKIDGLEVLSMQGANVMRNGEEVDLLAQLPDRTDKTPFRLFLGLEMRQLLTQALARLTEKERPAAYPLLLRRRDYEADRRRPGRVRITGFTAPFPGHRQSARSVGGAQRRHRPGA
jgi:RNA polymerase sigma factor for flagellar operon FliA